VQPSTLSVTAHRDSPDRRHNFASPPATTTTTALASNRKGDELSFQAAAKARAPAMIAPLRSGGEASAQPPPVEEFQLSSEARAGTELKLNCSAQE